MMSIIIIKNIFLDKDKYMFYIDGCIHHYILIWLLMMARGIIMSIHGMSDKAILREIGCRLRRMRLEKNISQQKLADMAGLNRTTIRDIEQGIPFGVLTLIQVLRALNALEELDSFLPDPGISPLQLAKMKGKERQRASRLIPGKNKVESEW